MTLLLVTTRFHRWAASRRWIHPWLVVAGCLVLAACGTKKKDTTDNGSEESEPGVSDVRRGSQPDHGDDATAIARGLPGKTGKNGKNGKDGVNGMNGKDGEKGDDGDGAREVTLVDAAGQEIGIYVSDDGEWANVMLPDSKRLRLHRGTGEVGTLLYNFFCLYESRDCSGACYTYDWRWLDVIIRDVNGQLLVASGSAVNQGPKLIQSYVNDAGICQEDDITTAESYMAQTYVPKNFQLPLAGPLAWQLRRTSP